MVIPATPAAAQDATNRVLFTNVNVWDGTSDALQNGMSVLVEGNEITQIAASISASGATVIDGGGRTLMPGLIDMHTHIMFPRGLPEHETEWTSASSKVNSFTFRFWELNFQQRFLNNRVAVVLGKIDPTNYLGFHGLIHPFMNFRNYGNSVSPSANWPNSGTGVVAMVRPTEQLYVLGGLNDVQGDKLADGDWLDFGDQFFEGNFFKTVEVGYTPSYDQRYFKKVSLTYWHADAYTGSAQGSGVTFAGHWFFEDTFIPFLTAGFSDGNGANTLAKSTVTAGHGYRFNTAISSLFYFGVRMRATM